VTQPSLEEVLVYQEGAADTAQVVSETDKARVVVVFSTEAKEHADSAIGSHDIIESEFYQASGIIFGHLNAGSLEHFELGVESTRTKLFYVGVHKFFQIFVDPFKQQMSPIVLGSSHIPV
jgi:hypothetical protein